MLGFPIGMGERLTKAMSSAGDGQRTCPLSGSSTRTTLVGHEASEFGALIDD